ncbi:hypothetical protein [Streptomyces sp. NPDC088923]|uniref:hypothetical protein n=1 Tax=Streptomyces sp. NPDC088923 TaxID=3365913 RepID=UPI0038125A74
MAARWVLAAEVCRELVLAGLPASLDGAGPGAGASVGVDGGDRERVVHVDWSTGRYGSVRDGVRSPLERSRLDAEVGRHMDVAITGILRAAGYAAEPDGADDDATPGGVRVARD